MPPLIEFVESVKSIGLFTRAKRKGPERDLVDRFVSEKKDELSKKALSYALFHEPELPTGFPDVVIVSYNPRIFETWKTDRLKLNSLDIKILHHLNLVHGSDTEGIEKQLGMDGKVLIQSLERLHSSDLIRWYAKKWMPRSQRKKYAIRSIIAIEAKIKNWKSAFSQAEINRWFASESYILTPSAQPTERILQKSQKTGVGILIMPEKSRSKKIRNSLREEIPLCYVSWLFNEWIGRYLYA